MYKLDIDLDKYPIIKSLDNCDINTILTKCLDIGYNNIFINNNIKLELDKQNNNSEINNLLTNLKDITTNLFGINNTSNKKGELSENIINNIFINNFQNYQYEITRSKPHCGDGLLKINNIDIIVEIKNYTNIVNNDEIDKLKYDMKYNNIRFGLFLSFKSGICGKKTFDFEKYEDSNGFYNYIVYISYIFDENHKIQSGLLFLENLLYLIDNISKQDNKISKDLIEIRNKNYYIHDILVNKITDIIKEIETTSLLITKIRDDYLIMEKNIKLLMDDFYIKLRDLDYQLCDKIKKIFDKSKLILGKEIKLIDQITIKQNIINKYSKDKIFSILSRVFDIFNKYDFIIIDYDLDNNIIIIKDNIHHEEIGKIKIQKQKIIYIDEKYNMNMTLSLDNNSLQFIESIFISQNIKL